MPRRQIEEAYGREVTGLDQNENGLRHSSSKLSRVCHYDIYQREPAFEERFDLIFLWDVIEHIRDDDGFVEAVMFHFAPEVELAVNVSAGEWTFSSYDRAAGDFRRIRRALYWKNSKAKWA
jgi:2-polyprenyl-3-methyl-5-hydroxy-6-metoxy-1,4-benzoquinol methylase